MILKNTFGGVCIKKYAKFNSYKTVFVIFLITAVISSVVGTRLAGKGFSELSSAVNGLSLNTETAYIPELMLLLWVFTAGPTIYAPVSSFLAITTYGLLFGARLSCGSGVFELAAEVFFSTVTAYLLTVYSSFVTLTSMRIFTDTKADGKRELFDGVMFRAEGFKRAFNLRFILSYILFFVFFALLLGIFSYIKALLLSL